MPPCAPSDESVIGHACRKPAAAGVRARARARAVRLKRRLGATDDCGGQTNGGGEDGGANGSVRACDPLDGEIHPKGCATNPVDLASDPGAGAVRPPAFDSNPSGCATDPKGCAAD